MWELLRLPRFRGATHASGHDNRSRHCKVSLPSWIRAITDHLRVDLRRHYAASYTLKGDRPRSPTVRQALWAVNANGKGDHVAIISHPPVGAWCQVPAH